jgi:1,4-alpha-glucan branching enzyme
MHKGYLCIVLHAHLPYIRHPEYKYFLEENWLFEAITETYIPLLDVFEKLISDNINFRITLSLSPPLIEMFNDDLLRKRYKKYINNLIALTEKELFRTKGDIHFEPVVKMYYGRLRRVKYLFEEIYKKDLVSVFKSLLDTDRIEIISSAATHAFLPNISVFPQAVRAQIKVGSENYKINFGRYPKGIWLPECGFAPDFDWYLMESGIRFFFLETHGMVHATPTPRYSVYAPISCPSGVAAFGRDLVSAKQVWSSFEGYPGDFVYRDFYRDIGFDLDMKYLGPYINPDGIRTFTGLKYYGITGEKDNKKPYVIHKARNKAEEHARDFMIKKKNQIRFLSEVFKVRDARVRPIITAIYDAELFGHWWFEGLEWLDFLLRKISRSQKDLRTITPSEYLRSEVRGSGGLQICQPSLSSWGDKGYNEVWLNKSNDYVYRHLLKTTERMIYLAERFFHADGIVRRALNQAAREVLLAQHSDWTFMMKTGRSPEYAMKRFEEHIDRFNKLYSFITTKNIPEEWLYEIEEKDRIFQEIDFRVYSVDR